MTRVLDPDSKSGVRNRKARYLYLKQLLTYV